MPKPMMNGCVLSMFLAVSELAGYAAMFYTE